MELIVFLGAAGIAVIGAALLVSLHNLVRAVLAMILSFTGVAGLYLLLNAEFLAAVQILVYVGAVAILILFAVMLTNRVSDPTQPVNNSQAWLSFTVSSAVFVLLMAVMAPLKWPELPDVPNLPNTTVQVSSVANLGAQLLSTYLLPFEVASVVLLVALLGAIMLARE
ncbi:MAG: NADH-quinone oxidoreductase subunit J [Chloroflexi bacterium]|nr:NADH-quinone oxidoreductase subunit J [Chloroflexota bacterium]